MLPRLGLSLLALSAATPACAIEPPDGIRQMIWTALDTKDPTVIAAVVAVAKQTAPESAEEIDMIAHREAERIIQTTLPPIERKAPPKPEGDLRRFDVTRTAPRWQGSVELGGSRSTGNTDSIAVYGGVDLTLKGFYWTHKINARADYQEREGASTAERFAVAYQPQYYVNEGIYTYGLGQFEHDRFQGYKQRYTLGAGVGWKAVSQRKLNISVDAGPALRRTRFYDLDDENTLAGRASVSLKWLPLPNVTIGQETAFYIENARTTARATTAIDTLVWGPLKARLSYDLQLERDRHMGRSDVDTTTRATLVYGF
jgi:putative salt-induced outer membrane protein